MYTLYFTPFACSLATHIALREIGEDHRLVHVVRGSAGTDAELARVNPSSTVPVLVTEDRNITQSQAILIYLAERHRAARLLPEDATERSRALEFLAQAASDVHPLFRPLFRPERFAESASERATLDRLVRAQLTALFSNVGKQLSGRSYVAGENFSIADLYVLVFQLWADHLGIELPPILQAIAARLRERPTVRKAMEIEAAVR